MDAWLARNGLFRINKLLRDQGYDDTAIILDLTRSQISDMCRQCGIGEDEEERLTELLVACPTLNHLLDWRGLQIYETNLIRAGITSVESLSGMKDEQLKTALAKAKVLPGHIVKIQKAIERERRRETEIREDASKRKAALTAAQEVESKNEVSAKSCKNCNGNFTALKRKHLCHHCGGVVCLRCAPHYTILKCQMRPTRVCLKCEKVGIPSGALKTSFLKKIGVHNSSFKRRWFILVPGELHYYKGQFDEKPLGVIRLSGCLLQSVPGNDSQFCLILPGASGRKYVLMAANTQDRQEWNVALDPHCHRPVGQGLGTTTTDSMDPVNNEDGESEYRPVYPNPSALLKIGPVLNSKQGYDLVAKFLKMEYSEENLYFWAAINEYRKDFKRIAKSGMPDKEVVKSVLPYAQALYDTFIRPDSEYSQTVNIGSAVSTKVATQLEATDVNGDVLKTVFDEAQAECLYLISRDSFTRFRASALGLELKKGSLEYAKKMEGNPTWTQDEDCKECQLCEGTFTLVNRRHHCRACGTLVCGKCSPHFHVLKDQVPKRVCKKCEEAGDLVSLVITEGTLSKLGQRHASWQSRHFMLLPECIMYFKKKYDKEPRGTIKFEPGCMVIQECTPPFTFSVVLGGMAVRRFVLTAANQAECDGWVMAVKNQLTALYEKQNIEDAQSPREGMIVVATDKDKAVTSTAPPQPTPPASPPPTLRGDSSEGEISPTGKGEDSSSPRGPSRKKKPPPPPA